MQYFNIINESKNIVRIELCNGKKHNPLSLELIKNLISSLQQISSQEKVKVIIISSEGPGFSAGHDLEELRKNKNNKEFFKELFNECSNLMQTIINLPQPRNLSRKKIMEMLLTGEKLSAKDAVDYGLINHCVSLNELQQKTLSLASVIASKPLSTVKIGKEAFYKQVEMPIDEAYRYTSEVMAMNMMEMDAYEGISAFLDKRTPSWNE